MARSASAKWDEPFGLAAGAILLGWIAFGAAQLRHWSAWPIGVLGSLLALGAFHRGRLAAAARQAGLEDAAAAAAARNRELDLLRGLAATLLSFRSSEELFDEVARVAMGLARADGGAAMLRSGEGQFLRVAAGEGLLRPAVGRLLPVEGSFAGAGLLRGESIRTDHLQDDPRNHPVEGVDSTIQAMAITPLRSRGETIGVIAVSKRVGAGVFSDDDINLLETLAEQVEVGLDRAALLEDARQNQLALEESNRELVKATQLKSQFLANMSHELRTPLNAIIGFSDLIRDDEGLDETQRDYLDSIARNGRHLLELINGVLDVARLEAGRMTLRLGRVEVRTVVHAAIADTASLRAVKRQQCVAEMGNEPIEIQADGQKVRQVLFNLLSNASKFTEDEGRVTVSITRTRVPLPASGEQLGLELREAVWIAVRDTGVGIRGEDLGRLFEAFSQVDSSASRSQQGSGLGLALCKELVELHGGTIGVESALGQGSNFWFVLPVAGPAT